jgi:PIN domain nuclease of toxin-antitoxin system
VRVVLDAWALIAFFNDSAAAPRVEAVLEEGGGAVCSINLGEVLYRQTRAGGAGKAREDVDALRRNLDVVDPDWPLVEAAAGLKARGGLSFADAFCVATATRLDAPIWTGDPQIIELSGDHEVVDLR